jgi:hypothetical protein
LTRLIPSSGLISIKKRKKNKEEKSSPIDEPERIV